MTDTPKQETILGQLRGILEESSSVEPDWDSFGPQSTIESLGLDSLTILDLLYDIEEDIGIHLEAKEVLNVTTVGEIIDMLVAKLR